MCPSMRATIRALACVSIPAASLARGEGRVGLDRGCRVTRAQGGIAGRVSSLGLRCIAYA